MPGFPTGSVPVRVVGLPVVPLHRVVQLGADVALQRLPLVLEFLLESAFLGFDRRGILGGTVGPPTATKGASTSSSSVSISSSSPRTPLLIRPARLPAKPTATRPSDGESPSVTHCVACHSRAVVGAEADSRAAHAPRRLRPTHYGQGLVWQTSAPPLPVSQQLCEQFGG